MDAYPLNQNVIHYPSIGAGTTIDVTYRGDSGPCSQPFAFADFPGFVFQYFVYAIQVYRCVFYARPGYPHWNIVDGLSTFTGVNISMSGDYQAARYSVMTPPPVPWIWESSVESPTKGDANTTTNPPSFEIVNHRLTPAVNILHTFTHPLSGVRYFQIEYHNPWGTGYWRADNSTAYDGQPLQEVFWELGIGYHTIQLMRLYVTPAIDSVRRVPSLIPVLAPLLLLGSLCYLKNPVNRPLP